MKRCSSGLLSYSRLTQISIETMRYDGRVMANARWMEYRLFCPICNDYFTQLVVFHKLPKNFKMDPHLAGIVEGP
jgi:hypothetical protein